MTTETRPISSGPFAPSWKSLSAYKAPQWFRDAKFGIWAHWGPQCQPEAGDWYARNMYSEGHRQNRIHVGRCGHPSEFGFKDVINSWKADRWDPDRLVALYKRVGARYFFGMANHHDNLDLWDSRHHAWNSVRVGPKKDIIHGWARAAREQGLRFGVSVHAGHAWSWLEVAQGADKTGDKAGVPYDGKLKIEDGKGKWWEGLDPQELYSQNHEPSPDFDRLDAIGSRWNWGDGVTTPDAAYCQRFHDRTIDLIDQAEPDLIYFDDNIVPLWPVSHVGLRIAAHFYNSHVARHGKEDPGVFFGKSLSEDHLKSVVWDIERGIPGAILPHPWQTDTCIGDWHYDQALYDQNKYKSAETVIQMLVDIVSKNGNLLLSVPLRGDGSIDDKAERILEGVAAWLDVNGETIFETRPWKTFGEGPASDEVSLSEQAFNEEKLKPFSPADVRYTQSKDGGRLYVTAFGAAAEPLRLTALGHAAGSVVHGISLIGGSEQVRWEQREDALVIDPLREKSPSDIAIVFKVACGSRPLPSG